MLSYLALNQLNSNDDLKMSKNCKTIFLIAHLLSAENC